MKQRGLTYDYETLKIKYTQPEVKRTYTPDFLLKKPDGTIMHIEVKGEFSSDDRKKTLLVLEQHPGMDLRFIFGSPGTRLSKASKTTYAAWCNKYGIKWAGRKFPQEWVKELA